MYTVFTFHIVLIKNVLGFTPNSHSEPRELALGPLAFVGGLPPCTPAQQYQQKQELTQDQNPCPERVQPAVAQRVLERDCGLRESEGCDAAEAAVCGDGRRGAASVGIDGVRQCARIDPSAVHKFCISGKINKQKREKDGLTRT